MSSRIDKRLSALEATAAREWPNVYSIKLKTGETIRTDDAMYCFKNAELRNLVISITPSRPDYLEAARVAEVLCGANL